MYISYIHLSRMDPMVPYPYQDPIDPRIPWPPGALWQPIPTDRLQGAPWHTEVG